MVLFPTARAAGATRVLPARAARAGAAAAPRSAPARARRSSSDSDDETALSGGSGDERPREGGRVERGAGAADPSACTCHTLGGKLICDFCHVQQLEEEWSGESSGEEEEPPNAARRGRRAPRAEPELTGAAAQGAIDAIGRKTPAIEAIKGLNLPTARLTGEPHHALLGYQALKVSAETREAADAYRGLLKQGADEADAAARQLARSRTGLRRDRVRLAMTLGAASAPPSNSAPGHVVNDLVRLAAHSAVLGTRALEPSFKRKAGRQACPTFKKPEERYTKRRKV